MEPRVKIAVPLTYYLQYKKDFLIAEIELVFKILLNRAVQRCRWLVKGFEASFALARASFVKKKYMRVRKWDCELTSGISSTVKCKVFPDNEH